MKIRSRLDGFVYLVHAPELKLYKIGRTRSLDKRVATLQWTIPSAVYLHSWIYARFAGWLEAELHRRLARHRHLGEWFILDARHVRRIQLLMWMIVQYQVEIGLPELVLVDPLQVPVLERLTIIRRKLKRQWPVVPRLGLHVGDIPASERASDFGL